MRTLSLLIIMLAIAGCFPATTELLRNAPSNRVEFTVPGGYQAVYRRVVPMARKCGGESAGIAEGSTIRADLYTDIRKAEIAQAWTSIAGEGYSWAVDLEWIADDRTKVTVYQASGRNFERVVNAWANGVTECGAYVSFPPPVDSK